MTDYGTTDQPAPVPACQELPGAHQLVIDDLVDRAELGLDRYGTRLLPNNGRFNLLDFYQELLDGVAYVRNLMAELELNDPASDRAVIMPNGRIAMRCSGVNTQPWITTDPIEYPDGKHGLQIRHLRDDEIPPSAVPLDPRLVAAGHMVLSNAEKQELYEKLAEIEHIRWSQWQRYVHSVGKLQPDGSLVIPPQRVKRWTRAMTTDYADLSEEEKDGDRLQVNSYWELIFGSPYVVVEED